MANGVPPTSGSTGRPFGKYRLLERIAAGGMAEIFRAKYLGAAGITKSVVIKRILPHYAGNRSFVSMFINEAKIAVGLSHGNIAQVFDFGEIDGEYYLAMEFVHGQALSRVARRAAELGLRVPIPIALYIVAELCNGLHYAHSRADEQGRPLGIVHRDVSPQNVLVSYEGEVKIVDFGIAKIRSQAGQDETERGALKGKYVYFSPEQTRNRLLDGRSDVFATGIVLYELLAGRRPFDGKMIDVLSNIVKGVFQPPSRYNPQVTPELEMIVLKAMATDPARRFASARQMHDALAHLLHKIEPGFSASTLQHFVRYLFRVELESEGLETQLPQEFVEQLERWRLPAGPSVATADVPLDGDRTGEIGGLRQLWVLYRKQLLAGAAAAAALLATGLYFLLRAPDTYLLELSSQPPGAAVVVDRAATGLTTPARVEELESDADHQISLMLPGHQPFVTLLPPQKGPRAALHATLVPLASAPSAQAAREDAYAAHREQPELPEDGPRASWPAIAELALEGQRAVLHVPSSAAARLRLDPKKTYELSAAGVASLGGPDQMLREVLWFGERADGTRAEGSFGQLGPRSKVAVSGLRAFYGFIVDDTPEDNSGTLKIRVAQRGGEVTTLLVDPSLNAVIPADALARWDGLAPERKYTLAVSGAAELGGDGGGVERILYYAVGSGEQGVLGAEAPVAVRGARSLWFFLPDDDALDNAGALTVKLASEPPR